MECRLSADNSFGPRVMGCRDDFDFTLLFEQTIFQITPCAILLLSFPWRTSRLLQQSVKTLQSRSRALKQIAIAMLTATQLALLIIWSAASPYRTAASIPAAVLSFAASLALLILSSFEHSRSIRPSSIINSYLLLSLVFDLPQSRTLWLRPGPRSLPGVFTAGMVAKAVVLILESRSKRASLFPAYRNYGPEALVSFINRTTVWWLNPLFLKGFRDIITFEQLYPLDKALQSSTVRQDFRKYWTGQPSSRGKYALVLSTLFSLKGSIAALMVPRLCLSALKLSQPLLINRITTVLGIQVDSSNYNMSRALIAATALLYLALAVANVAFKRQLHRFTTKLRATLVTALYSKTLVLSSAQLSNNAILTLSNNDTQRICRSADMVVDAFAAPLEIAVAIFLLERQVGVSCVAPAALSFIISAISFYNSNTAVPVQKLWLAAVTERVSFTASVLGCPKGFKMLGLTNYLIDRIQGLRVQELELCAAFRKYITYRNVFSHIPESFAPVITLMMFTLIQGSNALTPTAAFTSLSLVTLLTTPMSMFMFAIPQLQQVLASFERIQEFLDLEETTVSIKTAAMKTDAAESSTSHGIELSIVSPKTNTSASVGPLLSMDKATVHAGADKKIILQECSMQVKHRTLTLVVGPVGCGKSSLLKALIGDLALSKGTIDRSPHSSVAYCSQEPWLPNDIVKNLIRGFCSADETWYSAVVKACGLRSDIDSLPQADETIVGSKGVSLSGGQRARVALARAVYARKDVLIVDDALSGLDANTSRQVFDGLFGRQGLCKMHGTAVVLATHSIQYLSEADYIVVLTPGGAVAQAGSYLELRSQQGYVQQLKADLRKVSDNEADLQEATVSDKVTITRKQEDTQQDLARRTGDMAVYRYYLQSIGRKNGWILGLSCIGFAVFSKLPDLWVRWWSESSVTGHGQHSLATWISVYYVFAAGATSCLFLHIFSMLVWGVRRSSSSLHYKLLKTAMHAPYNFFVKTDSGVTLNRFSQDMSLIESELAGAFLQTMDGALLAIGSGALIAAGSKYVAAIIPALLLILYLIQKFYLRTSRQLRFMDLEAQAPLLAWFRETSEGASTIRAFGWQDSALERSLTLLDGSQRPYYLMLSVQRWLSLVLDLTTTAIAVIVVSFAMTLPGASSSGSIGVSMLNILTFNSQLDYVIQAWTALETSLGAVARCKNFESETPKEDKPEEVMEPSMGWPQAGSLDFTGVAACYEAGGKDVLKGISFSARPGEKIGICGRSGSGKSSTLLALLRMLDNHSGRMTLDGYDLASIPRQVIRERLTALPQEAITVPGSLKENLDPMGRFEEHEIKSALSKVGILHIVEERGGIDESIGQIALSQGQLQLFAVARALLRKSKVLILDELTSTIDSITEEEIMKLVCEEFAESTIIAVAHRLKTIAGFDKVLVMDNGRIVEEGNPQELLQKEGGLFRALWEQSGH